MKIAGFIVIQSGLPAENNYGQVLMFPSKEQAESECPHGKVKAVFLVRKRTAKPKPLPS